MPTRIKLIISVLVTLTALGVHFCQKAVEQTFNSWLVLVLGAFMIFAMWLFPEAKGRKQKGEQ